MTMTHNLPDAVNGDTFLGCRFTITVNGSPLNLTSGSVEMVVLANGAFHKFSTENGKMTIINPPDAGIVELNKQVIDINAYGVFNYKMIFKLSDGSIHTYLTGTWTISRN